MKYVRRTIWYVATRLLVISLILGMIVLGFYYAMSFTNIHVVLKDGMAQRTKAIMQIEMNENTLDKFFSASWLERDGTLNAALQGNSEYSDYNVRGIDHRLEMNFFWVWPWDTTVNVNITETVPRIDGRVKGTKAESVPRFIATPTATCAARTTPSTSLWLTTSCPSALHGTNS